MTLHPLVMLGEFCKTGSGGTPSRGQMERYYEGGKIPWVKSGELREGLITSTEENITEAALKETSTKLVPVGAILLAMYGATVGRLAILGIEATTNQAVCHIIPDRNVADTRYLYHAISAKVPAIIAMGVGGAQPNINQGLIKDLKISLPPLPEQCRIAAILDQADALRAKRREALAQLDSLTQSIFIEMFGDIQTIYEKWPVKPLGELLEFLTSGSRGWAEYYSETGALFLRIQNVCRDELNLSDVAYVSAPDTAEAQRTEVQEGDVLLSITADLGRTAVVPKGIGKAHINQHLSILRTKVVAPRYLSALITSPVGQLEVMGRNKQGVKAGLNFEDIRSFRIPIPPSSMQSDFVERVELVEKQLRMHRQSLKELDNLFLSLQHRAFRGEL